MHLQHTKKLMQAKLDEGFLDTYAVLVGVGNEECMISSDNVNADTYFDIASMGKVLVTSTLILRAMGEGKLRASDTLPCFFDNVPEDKCDITVKQLLTHTSGITRGGMPDAAINAGKEGIIAHILEKPLSYPIGTDYIYSCYGYLLLGYIVEAVYGMPLDEAYNVLIKAPLQLDRMGFGISPDEGNIAVTHYRAEVGKCACADDIVYRMGGVGGNGASFWCMNALQKFTRAVLAHDERLYSREMYDLSERDYTPSFSDGRGLGWLMPDARYAQTGNLFAPGSFGHCGNTGCSFFMERKNGLYVIILSNAMRFRYIANDFTFKGNYNEEYGKVMKMREDIHNAVRTDLTEQHIKL